MEKLFKKQAKTIKDQAEEQLKALKDLQRGEKSVALSNISIHYVGKNIKSSCKNKNNILKISAPTWNDELPDGFYSISNIQDCFEYIIKKLKTLTDDNPLIKNI